MLDKARTFSGEEDAARAINWLNHTKDTEARSRVLEICEVIGRVLACASKVTDKDTVTPEAWDNSANVRELVKVTNKLNKLLEKHTYLSRYFVRAGRNGYFDAIFWPVKRAKVERYKGEALPTEFWVIKHLLRMAEDGLFWRLAKCNCGQSYFRRFSHQRFCSEACRLREFRSSKEWKEHRARKAREYYWLHKSGKVK